MSSLFGVSRITVRQALGDLQKEDVIFKVPGKISAELCCRKMSCVWGQVWQSDTTSSLAAEIFCGFSIEQNIYSVSDEVVSDLQT